VLHFSISTLFFAQNHRYLTVETVPHESGNNRHSMKGIAQL